jgi:hypothetical protein
MTPKEYRSGVRIKWIERVGFVVVLGVLVLFLERGLL